MVSVNGVTAVQQKHMARCMCRTQHCVNLVITLFTHISWWFFIIYLWKWSRDKQRFGSWFLMRATRALTIWWGGKEKPASTKLVFLICFKTNLTYPSRSLSIPSARLLTASTVMSPTEVDPKIRGIVDQISKLTLLEVSELNQVLKEALKIPDAPVMAFAAGSGPATAAQKAEVSEISFFYTVLIICMKTNLSVCTICFVSLIFRTKRAMQEKPYRLPFRSKSLNLMTPRRLPWSRRSKTSLKD